MNNTKPGILSKGVLANSLGAGTFLGAGILTLLDPEFLKELEATALIIAGIITNIIGLWGRVVAKKEISSLF